ncbi:MAG: KilA-N domain-containing protein [Firmicutes bacterium]|nr:KilA-N domain-containing protein [Bacillota bacterium]
MKSKFTINDIEINIKKFNSEDYISLTDMAKFSDAEHTGYVITRWLSTRYTVEFMGIWEKVNNPNFNVVEFYNIRNDSGSHNYVLSSKQWIEKTNAIGIISNAGRYGGTFAHKDIAFEFATWLSAEFKFWIIKEFQRLKEVEQKAIAWTAKRELARINYRIQTDAIKENLIVPALTDKQKSFVYADEADLLNVALFGKTACEWRAENPNEKGNIRDFATIQQLLVLANMESYNATLIGKKIAQSERLIELNNMARQQLKVLLEVDNRLLLPKGKDQNVEMVKKLK